MRIKRSEILRLLGIGRTQQFEFKRPKNPAKKTLRLNSITPLEKTVAIRFAEEHRGIWHVKLSYMMLDAGVGYIKPTMLYMILKTSGFFNRSIKSTAQKEYLYKPVGIHDMWHTDITYVKIFGVFYFSIVVLDGYSRYLLRWKLLYDMRGTTVADFIQGALDKYPAAKGKVRIVQDNGSCYVSNEYRNMLSRNGAVEIHIAPYHPETNGKAEAMVKIVQYEAIKPNAPQLYPEAVTVMEDFDKHYNNERLHSGIGFMTPADVFFGRTQEVQRHREEQKRKFTEARKIWNFDQNMRLLNSANYTNFAIENSPV